MPILPDPAPAQPTAAPIPDQKSDFSLEGISPDTIIRPAQLARLSQPEMEHFKQSSEKGIEIEQELRCFLPLIPPAVPFSLEEGRIENNYFLAFRVPKNTVFVTPLPGRVGSVRTIYPDGNTTIGEILVYYELPLSLRLRGGYQELKIQFLGQVLNPLFTEDQVRKKVRFEVGTPLFTSEGSFDLTPSNNWPDTLIMKNRHHVNVLMAIDEPRGVPLTKQSLIQTADGKIAWYAAPPLAK